MSEAQTVYEKAVTTERPAEALAQRHGFENVAALAESLPSNARVLDAGAGASPFGREVAQLRPDVTWVNFDYSYNDPAILEDIQKSAPKNVEFVAGDVTKLSEMYEPESFDAVFSYWLLPHLSLDNPEPAKEAARAIFDVTKQGGLMSIGPKTSKGTIESLKSGKALQITKDNTISADIFAYRIANETELSDAAKARQRLANEVATPYFGTTRYAKSEGKIPKILHPKSGEYVSPFTAKGVKTIGGLSVAMARHAYEQHKAKKANIV